MTYFIRRCFLFSLIACLLLCTFFIAFAEDASDLSSSPVLSQPGRQEIVEARTEYSKTFKNADGTTSICGSMLPMHYKDEGGKWQDIDTTIEDAAGEKDEDGESFEFKSVRNSLQVFFARHSQGWTTVRSGDKRLSFKLVTGSRKDMKKVTTSLRGNKVRAEEIINNCDLEYRVQKGALKEALIIKKAPVTAPVFEYRLRLHDLDMVTNQDGSFDFVDKSGKSVFHLPNFFMYDAKSASNLVYVQTVKRGNEYQMTVTPDWSWLSNPERQYPVTVDPSVTVFGDAAQNAGSNYRFFLYIPCTSTAHAGTTSLIHNYSYYAVDVNQYSAWIDLPYSTRASYEVWMGDEYADPNHDGFGTRDPYYWGRDESPYFKIYDYNTKAVLTNQSGQSIKYIFDPDSGQIPKHISKTYFTLNPHQAACVEMDSGHLWGWGFTWGVDCKYQITFQLESMSPPKPEIIPLPLETYGSAVTFKWKPVLDEKNYNSTDSRVNPSGISSYNVQYTTDPNFVTGCQNITVSSAAQKDGAGNYYYTTPALTIGNTYYFRVYAIDNDGNPINTSSWNATINPSGVRWSEITRTKCVSGSINTGISTTITGVSPGNIGNDGFHHTCDRNPSVSWTTNSTDTQIQLGVSEYYTLPEIPVEYTVLNINTSVKTAQTSWSLPDGNYVLYVRVGASNWSPGKLLKIDNVAPLITELTETQEGTNIYTKFRSNEEVKAELYYGDTPGVFSGPWTDGAYKIYDPAVDKIQLPADAVYYYLLCTDLAGNSVTTPVYQKGAGAGNLVVNADNNHLGLESWWNYQPVDLGKAGTAAINLNNGNMVISATDFSLPGRGIPLVMTRYYNSLTDYDGMLGRGWRTNFETTLMLDGSDLLLTDPDGSIHRFKYNSPTQYTETAPRDFRVLSVNTVDNSYTVTDKNGLRLNFTALSGGMAKLKTMVDRFGNQLTLTYDGSGRLSTVREASELGRTANFHYYDSDKHVDWIDFTPLEGANPSRTIFYTAPNRGLTDVYFDSDSGYTQKINVHYDYDNVLGLLTGSRVSFQDSAGHEVQDSKKNDIKFYYKSCRRSVAAVNTLFTDHRQDGSTIPVLVNYKFDYNNSQTTFTDPRNYQFIYNHNTNGQCTTALFPDGGSKTFDYNSDYQIKESRQTKTVFYPDGIGGGSSKDRDVITRFTYTPDGNGNLQEVTADDYPDPLNPPADPTYQHLKTRFEYQPEKNGVKTDLLSITDPRGKKTSYINTYDANEKLYIMTIDPPDDITGSYKIKHTFNSYGERTDKNVTLDFSPGTDWHFKYGYTGGLLSSLAHYEKNSPDAYNDNYYYTVYGEKKAVEDANKVNTQYSISSTTGNLAGVFAPDETAGTFAEYKLTPDKFRSSYVYDVNGNKKEEYNAQGQTTTYLYDELNQLYQVQSPEIKESGAHYYSYNHYDANGNLVESLDYRSISQTFEYDAMNRKYQTRYYDGKVEEKLIYDLLGRVIAKYDGKGNKIEYKYDSMDNMLLEKYFEGEAFFKYKIYYTYDQNGNMLTKTAPLSSKDETGTIITTNVYDGLNRPTSVTVSCVQNTKYEQSISYTYEAGMLKMMTINPAHTGNQIYTYYYDTAQRLDYMTNPSGQRVEFSYFPGGQREQKRIFLQNSDTSAFMTVDYKYDEAYLLKQLDYTWGGYYVKMGYEYNDIDKIIRNPIDYKVYAPSVVTALLNQEPPDSGVYKRPVVSTLLSGNINPVDEQNQPIEQYMYDSLGRLIVARDYGILPGLHSGKEPVVYPRYQRTVFSSLDKNGNPGRKDIGVLDCYLLSPGSETTLYNEYNRIVKKDVSAPGEVPYTVDPITYDDNGQLLKEVFSYGKLDSTYEYGFDNQLLKTFSGAKSKQEQDSTGKYVDCYNNTTKSYTYELDGNLLRVKSDITEYSNTYNRWNGNFDDYFYYSHDGVIAEKHDDTGSLKSFTRFGQELVACNDNGSNYFYIQNMRGDVIMLVNDNKEIKSIRDYDVNGGVVSKAPDERYDRDPFGFTGGLDAGKGLWKLGARFYDSSKNSFIQQDRYMGDPSDPLSLNRYVYCGMDPVNYVDPTGFCALYIQNSPIMDEIVKDFDNWMHRNCPVVANAIDSANNFLNSVTTTPAGMNIGIILPITPGSLVNGATMTTTQALDAAEGFLGKGYNDLGNGRLQSADGLRQVRMGDPDILGEHGGGAHMNFETLAPNPAKPGKMMIINNIHIYLGD